MFLRLFYLLENRLIWPIYQGTMKNVSSEVRQSCPLMVWLSLESGHRSLDVWIGFSSVEGTEEGLDPQGEAFSLESCQNWLPGEPHPATAEHCVRLGPAGQCNTDLCSAPHSYVCELRPGGMDCCMAGATLPCACLLSSVLTVDVC